MSNTVVVVDYGIGNVFSVCNALTQIDADVELTRDPQKVMDADRLILPGVGAFARAKEALDDLGVADLLRRYRETERPFLGICIGMQLLMERSEEFGAHEGLGFFPGRVTRIVEKSETDVRVPHISWAPLTPGPAMSRSDWDGTPLEDVSPGKETVYYVHSYHCEPENDAHILAQSDYGGHTITAALRQDNLFGAQFHPERSGKVGQRVLKSFMAM